ncbi:copper type II ascorbate-dependent monooxygenase-like protein [Ulvibacter sp. MAR_2010_11]|uniref:redoxin domain-containing protein n=1 Tax=Ulvibacter sp. MAR_2010_11 TaxID=1250229 RepID=UPI000CB15E8A|nr:redoxin domain-containing protein [Ulvibacter sp. MAR_2010_11]PKA84603.1 copper type II ascorbate-dependent monooxygenase-like protein [Ulvibacter sp. MAR_2010_11]
MQNFALYITSILVCLGCSSKPTPVSDSRVNDYALFDASGGFHRLSYYNDSKAIVLWVQGNDCPIVRNSLSDFHKVVAEYSEKGFTFFMLNSNLQDHREGIKREAETFQFKVPVLDDSAQLLADALDIKITAEAIVLHPTTREILYRGPINNRLDYETQKNKATDSYLADALGAILKGKQPLQKQKMTRGCTVTRQSKITREEDLTYTRDIAPILEQKCTKCHVDGGIAPWAMTDYETVKGWSSMMKQVLLSKRMPPWKADPYIGEFSNSFAIEDSNARKIVRWIDNGLAHGAGEDILTAIPPITKSWKNGEPDEIKVLKPETLPATGVISYRYQKVTINPNEDRWLRGIEIQPGNNKVVHHIVVTNTERNQKSPITQREQRKWTDNFIALGGGGVQATFYPEGTGVFVPKNTELTLQIHYTTTGKVETDLTKIGLYYHESPPEKEFYSLAPSNTEFVIPAYGKNVHLSVEEPISRDIKIHYIVPHMHYRGKSITFSVLYPDGSKEMLVSVPDFNFNWQRMYRLKDPKFVPKGSTILVEGIYNNTYQNPFNPDPSKELGFGIQSTDEMLIGFFNYTLED